MPRHSERPLHRRRPGRVRAYLAAGMALGLGAVVTLAAFTDQAQMSANFATGTVNIALGSGPGDTTTTYEFADWSKSSMQPGDTFYAALQVRNIGSLPFTYTVSAPDLTGTDNSGVLGAALEVGIRVVTGACGADSYGGSSAIVTDEGSLSTRTISEARSLAVTGSETLCFKASLPATASDPALQGVQVTPVFTFEATQTTT